MSNKTSDKNVANIEDDVKRCNELIKVEHANWIGISNQLAISHILAEREQLLKERDVANDSVIAHKFAVMQQQINEKDKRIQELEAKLEFKKFGDLDNVEFEEYMSQFIPKQVVIDVLQNNRNELFSMTYLSKEQYRPYEMQVERINKIEQELLEGERK